MGRLDVVASKSGSVEYFGPGRTANPTGGLVQTNWANSQLDLHLVLEVVWFQFHIVQTLT